MVSEHIRREMGRMRTFSVNPKQRTCCLPLFEDAPLKEPGRSPLVVSAACNVMVGGRVWWGEPFVKALPHLVSYKAM
jgi:hypothetical protein